MLRILCNVFADENADCSFAVVNIDRDFANWVIERRKAFSQYNRQYPKAVMTAAVFDNSLPVFYEWSRKCERAMEKPKPTTPYVVVPPRFTAPDDMPQVWCEFFVKEKHAFWLARLKNEERVETTDLPYDVFLRAAGVASPPWPD